MSNIQNITSENFSNLVLKSEKPILVDFWAEWCGPCKMIAPILETISIERSDLSIVKMDVDKNQELAKKYGIRSIPTMMLFCNGEIQASKIGMVSKESLNSFLDNNID